MYAILWIIFLLFCIVAEFATSLSLITIWFMPGTIIAIILAILNVSISTQMIIFVLASVISLIVFKKIIKKHQLTNTESKTNVHALIGQVGPLQSDYTFLNKSSVKFGDVIWTVRVENNEELLKGTMVEVVAIEGNTLIVIKQTKSENVLE